MPGYREQLVYLSLPKLLQMFCENPWKEFVIYY